TGTVFLDVRFDRLPWQRELSMYLGARIGGVLLVSLLAALVTALLRASTGRWPASEATGEAVAIAAEGPAAGSARPARLVRGLVHGVGTVAIAGLVIAIFVLGARDRLEVGWTALGVAFAGAAIAEW